MKRRVIISGVATVVALLLYVLSIGPLAYAHYRLNWLSYRGLETFYAPLKLLPESRIITVPLKLYLELWLGPEDDDDDGDGG